MTRTYVVTGAASGMGRATAELLRARGDRVIGADLKDADVCADLASPDGRERMVTGVEAMSAGTIDGLIVCAGTSQRLPITVAINYFGAVATLAGLRPMLARGDRPRAVVITSYAAIMPIDEALVAAALDGDEAKALTLAEGKEVMIYTSSKAALARWCRAAAIGPEWAGQGILLNMVAPGMVDTPMIAHRLHDPAEFEALKRQLPLPLGRYAQPGELAELIAFLAGPANSFLVGQQIFADGGTEAHARPDRL